MPVGSKNTHNIVTFEADRFRPDVQHSSGGLLKDSIQRRPSPCYPHKVHLQARMHIDTHSHARSRTARPVSEPTRGEVPIRVRSTETSSLCALVPLLPVPSAAVTSWRLLVTLAASSDAWPASGGKTASLFDPCSSCQHAASAIEHIHTSRTSQSWLKMLQQRRSDQMQPKQQTF